MLEAVVYFNPGDHVVRLLTAIHILEEKKLLKCEYVIDNRHIIDADNAIIVEMQIDNKRIAFDMGDRPWLYHPEAWNYLKTVDMYFSRDHVDWSHKVEYAEHIHKLHPYGFNFYTTYPGNPANLLHASNNIIKNYARHIVNTSRCTRIEAFEGTADYKKENIQILFMTRLWDPSDMPPKDPDRSYDHAYYDYFIHERSKINRDRIEICRSLKKVYGSAFVGGIQPSPYAKKSCPDLILPFSATMKGSYLKTMKKSDICIGSAGLHKSIGWKTGEYVAAARAIVCEEPFYILPGNFNQGVHYLPYHDVTGCLEAVEKLYSSPDEIYKMKIANENYYQEYLRPDKQLLNALEQSGIKL